MATAATCKGATFDALVLFFSCKQYRQVKLPLVQKRCKDILCLPREDVEILIASRGSQIQEGEVVTCSYRAHIETNLLPDAQQIVLQQIA